MKHDYQTDLDPCPKCGRARARDVSPRARADDPRLALARVYCLECGRSLYVARERVQAQSYADRGSGFRCDVCEAAADRPAPTLAER